MSSASDEWGTPPEVLELVRRIAPIGLDPCTTAANPTGAARHFTAERDGLARDWDTDSLVFVNPPYSAMATWAEKVREEVSRPTRPPVVLLVPARTETRWYHLVLPEAAAVVMLRRRLRFVPLAGQTATTATFPSHVLAFNVAPDRVLAAFGGVGRVLVGYP
jgi:site-specific DNA-methyltransferase (adenine-specific)